MGCGFRNYLCSSSLSAHRPDAKIHTNAHRNTIVPGDWHEKSDSTRVSTISRGSQIERGRTVGELWVGQGRPGAGRGTSPAALALGPCRGWGGPGRSPGSGSVKTIRPISQRDCGWWTGWSVSWLIDWLMGWLMGWLVGIAMLLEALWGARNVIWAKVLAFHEGDTTKLVCYGTVMMTWV